MYSHLYRNIFFPFYETLLKQRNTLKYLRYLQRSQWYSSEQLKEIQWERLQMLIAHACKNVPFYKERFRAIGLQPKDIRSPQDLSKIPLLTKKEIMENQDTLIARDFKIKKIFSSATGGSTGIPLQFKLDHTNYEWRQAVVKRSYGWAGYQDAEKTIFIWGGSVGEQNLSKKLKHSLDEWLKRHKIYNVFSLTKETLSSYVRHMNLYRPKYIISYTTPLYNFSQFIKEKKIKVWPPQAIITAAEKLYPFQRELIQEVFNCPVFETYGCREVTSIAGECEKHNGMHINMETLYVEALKNGIPNLAAEMGEIIVTDLTNYCMPLIRYKNEDIGSLSQRRCECGRGLSLIENVEGRILDTLQTPDGRLVPGEFFPHLIKEFAEIEKFQVIQEDLAFLTIRIVQRKPFTKERLNTLKEEIIKVMGARMKVDFQFVNDIPLTPTGKFRVVTSKIPVNFKNG